MAAGSAGTLSLLAAATNSQETEASLVLCHGVTLLFCLSLFFILYVSVSVCLCMLLPNYSLVNKD